MSSDVLVRAWRKTMGIDRKQFSMFLDKILDGFAYHKIVVDKEGKPVDYVFLEVNRAFERMAGLKREQIIGKRATEALLGIEKDPVDWIRIYGRVTLTGAPVQFENYAEPLGKWFKVTVYCPEKAHFVVLFEDITERKKTQEALRSQKKELQVILDSMPAKIFYKDRNNRLVRVNKAFAEYMGVSKENLEGKLLCDLFTPDIAQKCWEEDKEVITTGQPKTGILDRYGSAQDVRWFSTDKVPCRDNDGNIIGTINFSTDITKRKKTEEMLRQSEERFRQLFSSMPSGVAVYDAVDNGEDFVFKGINAAAEKIDKTSKADLLGKRVTQAFPSVKAFGLFEVFQRVWRTGEPEYFPDALYKDDRVHGAWRENWVYKLPNGNIIAIYNDITQRKRAEEMLQESEKRLRNVVENSSDQIFMLDGDYRFLVANESAADLFGFSPQEMVGRSISEVFPETIAAQFAINIKNVFDTGKRMFIDEKIVAKGRELYTSTSLNPVINDKGRVVAVTGIVRDITERKKAEELLNKKQRELDRILDSSPTIIFYKDKEGKFIQANRAFSEALNMLKEHLLGKTVFDLYSAEIAQGMTNDDLEVMKSKLPKIGIVEPYESPTGLRWIRTDKIPSFDENGDVTGLIGFSEDITERKKLEKQMQDQERLAAIGVTAGMVGHDIRNPLQAIIGNVYLAETELALIPESDEKKNVLESLTEVEKNIDYINKIVADLQDFARPLNPHAEEADIKRIIDDLLSNNGLLDNVKVSVKVEPEASKVVADSTFINRIMYNLVTNAVQAMPKGGQLTIHAYRDKKTNDAILTVEDTGVGIPESVKDKLFTPMFTTKSKGQGFGLAVVKRMTESLGGTVSFESQEGKGTKFTVRFPLRKIDSK